MSFTTQTEERQRGDREATRVVLARKVRKADVEALAARLTTVDALQGATDAFARQGPGLWRMWCRAMAGKRKRGETVPPTFDHD